MEDCLFCKIINKEIDSDIVYENDDFLVIMDKFPDSPGHILIIPKKHISTLMDIDDETYIKTNKIIKEMVKLVTNKLNCDGVTVSINYGSSQYIKHYHIHIIPKYNKKIDLSKEEIYKKLIEK